jgi:hypothetical protein
MKRKTIYLPDEVSAALERLSEAEGRSQSDLVREGLRYVIDLHSGSGEPPIPLFMSDDPTLAERNAEARFRARAASGSPMQASELLDDLGRRGG